MLIGNKFVSSWKYNNKMILIACRKDDFKTVKVKCHGKVILLIF